MVGTINARAFEGLPKSEPLGTNLDDKKAGEICETMKKYLIQLKQIKMIVGELDECKTTLIHPSYWQWVLDYFAAVESY